MSGGNKGHGHGGLAHHGGVALVILLLLAIFEVFSRGLRK